MNNYKDYIEQIIFISKKLGIDHINFTNIDETDQFAEKKYGKSSSIKNFFLECKTIISAALSYNTIWNNEPAQKTGYTAHYTTANFYKMLSIRLKKLGKEIKNILGYTGKNELFFRVFVNSKINDKLCAYSSGLGSISKNTLISVNDSGQKFILGELLLSVNLGYTGTIIKNNPCINCDRCIKACPTGALKEYSLDKNKCLQHLSSSYLIPERINNKNFINLWKKRFFGCTDCLDVCLMNKNQKNKTYREEILPGFIGTLIDPEKILSFKKNDYKTYFKNNQLSASWIPTVVLTRNTLMLLFNLEKTEIIEKYYSTLNNYHWNEDEKEYLENFKKIFLK